MSESNIISDLLNRPAQSLLDAMRSQLEQATAAGAKPIEWLVRLQQTDAVMEEARTAGVLTIDPITILGIKMRGSWKLLTKGEGPLLMCEGDEMHRALLAMYEPAAS